MDFSPEDIEKYLNNELSKAARKALEEKMTTDESFARKVNSQKKVMTGIRLYNWKESVKEVEQELEEDLFFQPRGTDHGDRPPDIPPARSIIRKWRNALSIAAGVLILLTLATVWWSTQKYSDVAIADNNFEFDIPEPSQLEGMIPSPLRAGQEAFEKGQWQESIEAFLAIPGNSAQYQAAQYYLGQVYFKRKEYAKARESFQIVLESGTDQFRERTDWMLLLTLLASGQHDDQFNNLLSRLINDPKHAYHQDAIELQSDLNRVWRKLAW